MENAQLLFSNLEQQNNEINENSLLSKQIGLGQQCLLNDICTVENAICLKGFCQCDFNYVQAGMVLCLTRSKSNFIFFIIIVEVFYYFLK